MSSQQAANKPLAPGASTPSDRVSVASNTRSDDKQTRELSTAPPLAPSLANRENNRMEAALGDAVLRFLRIRKGPKPDEYDLDAVRDECPDHFGIKSPFTKKSFM
jgi:hypothetical protein